MKIIKFIKNNFMMIVGMFAMCFVFSEMMEKGYLMTKSDLIVGMILFFGLIIVMSFSVEYIKK